MARVIENKLVAGPILAGGCVVLIHGVLGWGVVSILLGVVIVVVALLAALLLSAHASLGGLLILLGLASLVSNGGGNGLGTLLAVLGGTACVVYGPAPHRMPNGSPLAGGDTAGGSVRQQVAFEHQGAFPACRELVPVDTTVCPNCGPRLLQA